MATIVVTICKIAPLPRFCHRLDFLHQGSSLVVSGRLFYPQIFFCMEIVRFFLIRMRDDGRGRLFSTGDELYGPIKFAPFNSLRWTGI